MINNVKGKATIKKVLNIKENIMESNSTYLETAKTSNAMPTSFEILKYSISIG
jgi:hypothetical protein